MGDEKRTFKTGQVVWLRPLATAGKKASGLGSIICQVGELPAHWCVAMRDKVGDRVRIVFAPESEISSYPNVCWYCHTGMKSENVEACPRCGWLICPECGACMRPVCGSHGLVLPNRPGCYALSAEDTAYYETELIDKFGDEDQVVGVIDAGVKVRSEPDDGLPF